MAEYEESQMSKSTKLNNDDDKFMPNADEIFNETIEAVDDRAVRAKLRDEKKLADIRAFITETLSSRNENDEIDLNVMIHNATYNMGERGNELLGMLLRERVKLTELEDQLRRTWAKTYEAKMSSRYGFTPSQEGMKLMVEGDAKVSDLKRRVARQTAFIKFLEKSHEAIQYYPSNAHHIVEMHQYGKEIGMIV